MKQLFLIIVSIFLFTNSNAQTLEQNIQEIRTQFNRVNSQKDFKKVYLENEEFTDLIPSEGCGLDAYYKNGQIYKIVESDAVSQAVYVNEYYLKNNELIFVYRTETSYEPPAEEGGNLKKNTFYQERVYYKNGRIIRHLEKGTSVLNTNLDFQKMFKEYMPYLNTKIKFEKQYDSLQGNWLNINDKKDFFEIKGLIYQKYDEDFIPVISRFSFDGTYLQVHNTETNADYKYKILKFTDDKLEMKNTASGKIIIYERMGE
ncbi:MAG: hypothetical protein GXO80_07900 [Chlorobi bacterium]|nr:hypothetical protein [Chlorobiota bacterium]